MALLGDEAGADLGTKIGAHGDVLQIGVVAGEAPGRGHQLIERAVHAPRVGVDVLRQRLQVGVEQLGELAPLLHGRHYGVLPAQPAQHAGIRGVARLALLAVLQAKAPEEHLGQLLRRSHRELDPGETDDLVVQLVDTVAQPGRDLAQAVGVHLDAGRLHLGEHAHHRQLDLAEALRKRVWGQGMPSPVFDDGSVRLYAVR